MLYGEISRPDAITVFGGTFAREYFDDRYLGNGLYFAANSHVVKIGKSWNPCRRITDLNQPLSFNKWRHVMREQLDILLVVRGCNERHETNLHRRFRDEQIAPEWYPRHSLLGWHFDRLLSATRMEAA